MSDDVFEKGMALRRAVLGDKHVDQAEAKKTSLRKSFRSSFPVTPGVKSGPVLDLIEKQGVVLR